MRRQSKSSSSNPWRWPPEGFARGTAAAPGSWHPAGKHVDVGEHRLHVIDVGAGSSPPVLLLHGILVSSWAWRHTLSGLASSRRLVAPCHPGHGFSSKKVRSYSIRELTRAAVGVLDHLGLDQVDIVGNSLGGGVALRMALDHPDRVRRLVLVAPAAMPIPAFAPLLALQGTHFGALYRTVLRERVIRGFLTHRAYKQPIVDDEFMAKLWAPLASGETFVAAGIISRGLPAEMNELHEALPSIFKRTLVVWGDHDGLLSPSAAPTIVKRLPRAELKLFEACGHCPMEEHPGAFNAMLTTFLDS